MNLREAAQQALEALKSSTPKPRNEDDDYAEKGWKEHYAAITALRAALETQQTHSEDCWRWHHECAVAKIQIMRTPLTEQQLDELLASDQWAGITELARAVERWHHIGDSPC